MALAASAIRAVPVLPEEYSARQRGPGREDYGSGRVRDAVLPLNAQKADLDVHMPLRLLLARVGAGPGRWDCPKDSCAAAGY